MSSDATYDARQRPESWPSSRYKLNSKFKSQLVHKHWTPVSIKVPIPCSSSLYKWLDKWLKLGIARYLDVEL
jgi:hypothetical protein